MIADRKVKPRSNTLFHFTKEIKTLKLILASGFWPKYCLEDVSWLRYEEFSYVAYPMVCFCDIPLSRITEHLNFYGGFGLGLTRHWAETHGLNPVFYVARDNSVLSSFREFNRLADVIGDDALTNNLKNTLRHLLTYTKPTIGKMSTIAGEKEKEFYQESEWRYVLKHDDIDAYLTKSKFDDSDLLSQRNSVSHDKYMLKVAPSDIRYIFVHHDDDISEMVDYILNEMDNVCDVERNILVSRVVSIESISADM